MRKLLASIAIGSAVILSGPLSWAADNSSTQPIILGQVAELTGPYTSLGVDARLGAEQAVAEINAKGGLLNGRKLQLIVKDDKTDPSQAVIALNELADAGVTAIVGPVFSNASLAMVEQVNRLKVPTVSPAAADEQVKPITPYMFINSPLGSVVGEQLLHYFQANNLTKVAIAYASDQSFGKNGTQDMTAMAPKYGVKIVATETFRTATTNFSSVLTHLRGSDAQALMVWASGPAAVILTKQFKDANMNMQLVMSHAEASTLYTKPAGAAATGVIVAASVGVVGRSLLASEVKDTVQAMATTFEANNKYYPSQFAFAGYSAVKLIAAAITKADGTDRTKVQAALSNLTLLTPLGRYHYTAEDHAGLKRDDVAIGQVDANGDIVLTPWSAQQLKSYLNSAPK